MYVCMYRLATMLRHLATYHSRNARQLFMVRVAQGLIHMGKGTLTLNPFHTDRSATISEHWPSICSSSTVLSCSAFCKIDDTYLENKD